MGGSSEGEPEDTPEGKGWTSPSTPATEKAAMEWAYVGDRRTTVQHGEIPIGTFLEMLTDLGIDRKEF